MYWTPMLTVLSILGAVQASFLSRLLDQQLPSQNVDPNPLHGHTIGSIQGASGDSLRTRLNEALKVESLMRHTLAQGLIDQQPNQLVVSMLLKGGFAQSQSNTMRSSQFGGSSNVGSFAGSSTNLGMGSPQYGGSSQLTGSSNPNRFRHPQPMPLPSTPLQGQLSQLLQNPNPSQTVASVQQSQPNLSSLTQDSNLRFLLLKAMESERFGQPSSGQPHRFNPQLGQKMHSQTGATAQGDINYSSLNKGLYSSAAKQTNHRPHNQRPQSFGQEEPQADQPIDPLALQALLSLGQTGVPAAAASSLLTGTYGLENQPPHRGWSSH